MAKKGTVDMLMPSQVPVNLFSDQVQSLQRQIARLPELIRERGLLLKEIADRKEKVNEGILTERALDKPFQELSTINQTINMARNEWPQQIYNNLTGELKEELQKLRFKTRAARKIAEQSRHERQDAEERLNSVEARHDKANSSAWSPQEKQEWNRELDRVKREYSRACDLHKEMTIPLQNAETALAEFKQFCITGQR